MDMTSENINQKTEKISSEGRSLKEKKKKSSKTLSKNHSTLSNDTEAQQKRLQRFEDLVNSLTKEKITSQNQVMVLTQEKIQLEKVVDSLQKEKHRAIEERNELEIMLKESDVYGKTLREHVDELEQMGTTLHRQREEQNEYFMQKELNIKQKAKSQLSSALQEIDELKHELTSSKEQNHMLQDELQLIRNEKDELLSEKYEKKMERETLRQRLKALENDVEIEQETVKMLSEKNSKLSSRLAVMEKNLAKNKSEFPVPKEKSSLSRQEINEIDELLKHKTKIHQEEIKLRDQQILDLSQKVAKAEAQLSNERRSKQEALSRISSLENENNKLKKNSEILISYASRKNHRQQNAIKTPSAAAKLSQLCSNYYLPNISLPITINDPNISTASICSTPQLNNYNDSDVINGSAATSPEPHQHSTPHNLSASSEIHKSLDDNEKLKDLSLIENCA